MIARWNSNNKYGAVTQIWQNYAALAHGHCTAVPLPERDGARDKDEGMSRLSLFSLFQADSMGTTS